MSISDTRDAKKYASIAEVAAAQCKQYTDDARNAPQYADEAKASADASAVSAGQSSASSQLSFQSATSASNSASAALTSANNAAASAATAGSAAAAAVQGVYDDFNQPDGAGLIGVESGGTVQDRIDAMDNAYTVSREILYDLPLHFPDYDAILAANPTWAFLYPSAFTICDNLIYILYGPSVQSSLSRQVAVYDKMLGYQGYFTVDGGGTGLFWSASSEGIVVTTYYGGKKLFVGSIEGNLYGYDITSVVYGSSLTHSESHQVGLYNQFSFNNGVWIVEQNAPAVGAYRQRNMLAYFDASFNLTGFSGVDLQDVGYITSTVTSYGEKFTKRQGICLGPDAIVMAYGGVFIEASTVEAPTNYQGIKKFTPDLAEKTNSIISSPVAFIQALRDAGKASVTRIENEGVCYDPEQGYLSFWIYTDRTQPEAYNAGIAITKEFSANPNLHITGKSPKPAGYNTALFSSGVWPRVMGGDAAINPITGETITSITQVLDFMRLAAQKEVTVYTSSMPLTDFSGVPYPGGVKIKVANLNGSSFELVIASIDSVKNFRVNFTDPTYTQQASQSVVAKMVIIDAPESVNTTTLNRVLGRGYNGDVGVNAGSILMLDQQSSTTDNQLMIGGGSSLFQSATAINFSTNATKGALGGTTRWRIDSNMLRPFADNAYAFGTASARPTQLFAVTSVIGTSDAREKTVPVEITDEMLDAIDSVDIILFQWLSATQQKGDNIARWHFGAIAQQVRDAFIAHGLDGTRYGLLCYDEWEDEYEDVIYEWVDEDGVHHVEQTGEQELVLAAGNRWGLRADQCHWLLAAAARRRALRAEERLAAIEARLVKSGL